MTMAASTGDKSSIPGLIERLSSNDPAERLLAIRSLERLTGETKGYDHAASPQKRNQAIERWATWWEMEKAKASASTSR